MFNIDLFKGHGVPIKSKPGGTFIVAISFIVPVALASIILGNLLHNRILISTNTEQMRIYDAKINRLTPELNLRDSIQKQKQALESSHEELADIIRLHTQWSGALQALVENMPPTVVLEELDVKIIVDKKPVPKRYDAKKTIDVDIPKRTLEVKMHVAQADNVKSSAFRDFKDAFQFSPLATNLIEAVRMLGPTVVDKDGIDKYIFLCDIKTEQ